MSISRIGGVLCTGNICYDIPVWPVDEFRWGTTAWVEELNSGIGGNGANTSYTLGKLGCPARVYGVVGQDWQGSALLEILQSASVDTSQVQRSATTTNSTVCIVNSEGNRLFLHRLGCSSDFKSAAIRFDDPQVREFSHFHMANMFTLPDVRKHAVDILKRAREAGKTTSLDTGWDASARWIADVGPCLPYVDLMFVNETEAEVLTGVKDPESAAVRLMDLGVPEVVVKLGSSGSVLVSKGGVVRAPAFVVDAVDTTGAGDCFAGAFLAALYHELSYPDALRFANAVGALNVRRLGAVTGIVSYQETLAWMAAQTEAAAD